jgi:ATP-binding cassette subfamily B protein
MYFHHFHQPDAMDCGATCLAMIAKHYGKNYSIQKLREMCSATRAGVSLLGISDAAEKLGFKTMGVHLNFEKLVEEVPLPCIVHWRQEHFVVVYDIKVSGLKGKRVKGLKGENGKENSYGHTVLRSSCLVKVADPAHGLIKFTVEEFCNNWLSTKKECEEAGWVLLLEPTPAFY